MGNEISNAGCCGGPSGHGLMRDEERFGRIPEPMPVATVDSLKQERINEWSEPGIHDGPEPWWCGDDHCRAASRGNADLPGLPFRPVGMKTSAYLVADTPDGAMLMSTERGDGGGSMWLGDLDNDSCNATMRPVWDPSVRQEFRTYEGSSKDKRKGNEEPS
mmetsp:Transcript_91748/g.205404  ORF Transcript_91748/g.205404 Transcript_91748/m.205404 type:complete len:161 (-) Transcript_91748:202-684(-)